MISFDFTYYQPTTVAEAVTLHRDLKAQGKQPLYFAGGTEILTFGRVNKLYTEAVIDLKQIPECQHIENKQGNLYIGAALPLSTLREALQNRQEFTLFSDTARGIAEHTSRNKITVGGNLCGTIIFREMTLPLLVTDSYIGVAGEHGIEERSVHDICKERVQVAEHEFLAYMRTEQAYASCPSFVIKRRNQGTVGYPLVTAVAVKVDGQIRVAFSGYAAYPFRSFDLEGILKESGISASSKIDKAVELVKQKACSDVNGSNEYRRFLLGKVLQDILQYFDNDQANSEGDDYVQIGN